MEHAAGGAEAAGMAACALAALLAAGGCAPGESPLQVRLSDVEPPSAQGEPSPPPLRFAVSAMQSLPSSFEEYEGIFRRVARRLGRPAEVVLRPTYAETNTLLEQREVDAAMLCSGPYVEARRRFGAELLAAPQVRGRSTYVSYIIVGKDSPVRDLDGLRGETFAFTDPLSSTGRLFPTYLLARRGTTPAAFFGRIIFTHGHDNSVAAVAGGLAAGAAVHQLIYDKLSRSGGPAAARTRVLLESPPFGMPPVVVHPGLPRALKERLRAQFLSLHRDAEGRRILRRMGIDRFVVPDDSAYDPIRRMEAASGKAGGA